MDREPPRNAGAWSAWISDPATSGDALRAFAERVDADVEGLALLAGDAARLRADPAIAAAIYANPSAPLSVANRAVATCHEVRVVADGIPGFEELALAIASDPAALDAAQADPAFNRLMEGADGPSSPDDAVALAGAEVTTAKPTEVPDKMPTTTAPRARVRSSATIDFGRLKLYEKIRLATLGNAYCRQNLLRDSNRMVAMAVIRSPQITDGEIAKAAGNRALSEEVIRYIGNRKELVKHYAVKLALVGNPKCPLAVTLRLLSLLSVEDVKQIARSKNVPGALSTAAKRLAAAKAPQ